MSCVGEWGFFLCFPAVALSGCQPPVHVQVAYRYTVPQDLNYQLFGFQDIYL